MKGVAALCLVLVPLYVTCRLYRISRKKCIRRRLTSRKLLTMAAPALAHPNGLCAD
jgi:hypothetical protein